MFEHGCMCDVDLNVDVNPGVYIDMDVDLR